MTRRWMSICSTCGTRSECLYRCDDCGADLTNEPVEEFRYPTDAGRRKDGLVEVRFPMSCLECDTRRLIPLDYADVGRVIRFGCLECGASTKHRPTDAAIDYRLHRLDLADGIDVDEQPDDQSSNPTISTPT